MEAGLCDHLVLADINERAIESVRKTVARNPHLYNRVTAYVSDNLKAIPPSERFDLVVANPPFFQVPREVSFSRVVLTTGTPIEGNSLIGSDPEWKIHRDFFKGIPRFLGPDSIVLIAEFEPFEQEPRVFPAAKAAIDTRARPPVADFYTMIRESGLRLREVVWAEPRDPAKPNTRIIGAKDPEVLRELNSGDHFWLLVVTPSRMTPLE